MLVDQKNSLTDSPIQIHTFSCVAHSNTLELLLHLHDLIPCPSLSTTNHVDKRSVDNGLVGKRLLINTLSLPFLVAKQISLSTSIPTLSTSIPTRYLHMLEESRHAFAFFQVVLKNELPCGPKVLTFADLADNFVKTPFALSRFAVNGIACRVHVLQWMESR